MADTFYPSNDGFIAVNDTTTSWASVHDAATGSEKFDSVVDGLTIDNAPGVRETAGVDSYDIFRSGYVFDTSSLPNNAVISSAIFSIYVSAKVDGDNDAQGYLSAVSFSPANPLAFATADYNDFGTTKLSDDVDITGVTLNAYNDFTLNATGIAAISLTGNTILGIREGHDIENSAITISTTNRVTSYFSAESGTSKDPKLVVTYTISSPSTSRSTSISSSISTSISSSLSPSTSISNSISASPSPSTSISSSISSSVSPSASISSSISASISTSISSSVSPSHSISSSISPSTSISSSPSISISPSPSPALWTPRTKPTTNWTRTRP